MIEHTEKTDVDFSAQLQALVVEAQKHVVSGDAKTGLGSSLKSVSASSDGALNPSMLEMMRQILNSVEGLVLSQHRSLAMMERVRKTVADIEDVPRVMDEARGVIEGRGAVNRAMFEAMHAEMRGYKDLFMLEVVLKPVIADLMAIFDSAQELVRQMKEAAGNGGGSAGEKVSAMDAMIKNMEHHAHFIIEVLGRLNVALIPEQNGKLDKIHQRAVAVELADHASQDQQVVRVVRRGFTWRERLMRPEEVVIKKWDEKTGKAEK